VRLRFVVPADVDEPTGGNVYDLALAAAMRDAGDEVELCRCERGELSTVVRQPWPGPTLVDGLLACTQPQGVAPGMGVLVHMPLGLQLGLDPGLVAQVDEMERQTLHGADLVVATSQWSARYLTEHHGLSTVAVAPPGAEPAMVSSGSNPPLLVHVSAVLPHKDQLGLVAALARLTDLPWQVRLAGSLNRDPDYAAAVIAAVHAAGLTARIQLPGVMDRDTAWSGADLALLPSLVESFGLVVTEALARGIPVIVSEGGPAEALGVTEGGDRPGAIVRPGDPDALARILRRWLTDGEFRERLRSHALYRRERLTGWDVTARQVRRAVGAALQVRAASR
jgi:glycosyltransferase involved in cell wall biosynthesis